MRSQCSSYLKSNWEGEEHNREEGEMAQKSWEEGEKEKLRVGRIELDGPG